MKMAAKLKKKKKKKKSAAAAVEEEMEEVEYTFCSVHVCRVQLTFPHGCVMLQVVAVVATIAAVAYCTSVQLTIHHEWLCHVAGCCGCGHHCSGGVLYKCTAHYSS